MDKKLFSIDEISKQLLTLICSKEGINASEFLRLCIRAWRSLDVYDNSFQSLTTYEKSQRVASKVKNELDWLK